MHEQPDQTADRPLAERLAAQVERRIKEAFDARRASGIEEIWAADEDQYNGFDELSLTGRGVKDQGQVSKQQSNGRSRVFLNITKPKTDAAVARIVEMLLPHDDKPWGIEPTPVPEFQTAAEDEDDTLYTLADGSQATGADVAKAAMAKAGEAAEAMADWIEDRFVEGSVYAELRKIVRDAGRIGTGVVKGPVMVSRTERKWQIKDGAALLEMAEKLQPTSKRIDPRDFAPDPACGEDIHQGSYVVERDYMTARQLRGLAKDPSYDAVAIAAALREGPTSRSRDRDRFQDTPGETVGDSDVFELYYYYGDVDPATLMELGVDEQEIGMTGDDLAAMGDDAAYLVQLPAIVTMLNGKPIKAAVNPLETGEFPYDVFPWEPVDGQPWGRGVPHKIATAQRMLNAATRAMLENAGLSAGAQIGITQGALTPADGKYEITGRKLWFFKPNDAVADITKAMQVWTIPSIQNDLAAIIEFSLKMADELTNLPMLLQGQSNREGGASTETVGGMSMALNAANAPLRVIAKQFDDYLVIPHLRRYYDLGMQMAPEECKGDLQVQARGSTALIQREIAREYLMQLAPLVKDPAYKIDPERWMAETSRAQGFNLKSIQYTEDEWKRIEEQQAQNPPTDPRIEAAKIRADADMQKLQAQMQDMQAERQFEAADRQAQREMQGAIAEIQRQIQMMRLAGDEKLSLESIKADLAAKAVDSRDKRELFLAEQALKLSPENPTNEGI